MELYWHQVGVAECTVSLGIAVSFLLGAHRLWRIPLLAIFGAILAIDMAIYVSVRFIVKAAELVLTARLHRRRRLQRLMDKARTFEEWSSHAESLDADEKRQAWKGRDDDLFHPRVVRTAVRRIRAAREARDVAAFIEAARPCLVNNFAGVMNRGLYDKTHCGTKRLVEEYVAELEGGLDQMTELATSDLAASEELRRFAEGATQAFGRTALLLSGGATLGNYHYGVLRALLAKDLLPNVLCGASMGAIILCFLASRTNAEALAELESLEVLFDRLGPHGPVYGSKREKLWWLLTKGYLYEHAEVEEYLQYWCRGLTFREAFERTGRVINITCTPTCAGLPSLLLNHLTAPDVTLTSACMASACIPGLIKKVTLMEKCPDGKLRTFEPHKLLPEENGSLEAVEMRDGSFENDVPVAALCAYFNTQFSIVSQTNPHIVPFFFNATGALGQPVSWPWRKYRGGFFLSLLECWCKEDMLKNLKIIKSFGLLFRSFGVDWNYLCVQEEVGDVTITANVSPKEYWQILDNATDFAEFQEKIRSMERTTWRSLAMIQTRCRIERALDKVHAAVSFGGAHAGAWSLSKTLSTMSLATNDSEGQSSD